MTDVFSLSEEDLPSWLALLSPEMMQITLQTFASKFGPGVILLINIKMQTIVGVLILISRVNLSMEKVL